MLNASRNPFAGVWTRDYICFDGGSKETQQQVIWIQGQQYFADVRSHSLTEKLTPERYSRLGWRQQFDVTLLGFAGSFCWEALSTDSVQCTWHHTLSLFPGGFADVSECTWLDHNSFIEIGCYEDKSGAQHIFEECWCRLSRAPAKVWQLQSVQEKGICLMADRWAVVIHDWRLPEGPVLDNPATLSAFSATCWQHIDIGWVLSFCTEPLLGSASPWTPDRILSVEGVRFWQEIGDTE